MKRHHAVIGTILSVLTIFICILTIVLPVRGDGNRITSCTVNTGGTEITVSAELTDSYISSGKKSAVYLFALAACDSEKNLSVLQPAGVAQADAEIVINVPITNRSEELLYARFLLAEKNGGDYTAITDAVYVSNPENAAKETFSYPVFASKKGLRTQLDTDAQILGISHTVINLPINEFFAPDDTPEDSTVRYIYDGQTFLLDRSRLEVLDHKIRILSQAGVNCYLKLLLTAPVRQQSAALSCLYPAETDGTEAPLYAINTENADALRYVEGFLSFISNRYSRQNGEHGFAASFIIGNEVNRSRTMNFMDKKTLGAYVSSYARLFRIAYTAVVSEYSEARVYVSLGNNFGVAQTNPLLTEDPQLDYSGKAFLDAFAAEIRNSGELPWRLAIHPFPSDAGLTDLLSDEKATDDIQTTPFVTMKNISALCAYLRTEAMSFEGNARSVLVSDFAVSGQAGTENEELQAAVFCYAYYTAYAEEQIEALIWHRQIDHPGEVGLYYGLWSSDGTGAAAPEAKKQLYNVFRYIDTERLNNLADETWENGFALPLLGADSWEKLTGTAPQDALVRGIYEQVPTSFADFDNFTPYRLYDFSKGMYTFYPSDNANYLELQTDEAEGDTLFAKMYPANRFEYCGISDCGFASSFNLRNTAYISLRIRASCGGADGKLYVILRLTGQADGKEQCFEGIAQVTPDTWTTVCFPIDGYTEKVTTADSLRIWIKAGDDQSSEVSLSFSLAGITLYKSNDNPIWKTVIVIALLVAGIVLAGFLVVLTVMRHRTKQHHVRRERKRVKMKKDSGERMRYHYRSEWVQKSKKERKRERKFPKNK